MSGNREDRSRRGEARRGAGAGKGDGAHLAPHCPPPTDNASVIAMTPKAKEYLLGVCHKCHRNVYAGTNYVALGPWIWHKHCAPEHLRRECWEKKRPKS